MDFKEFKESLKQELPPEGLRRPLEALWWDAKGNWDKAHKVAQDIASADGAWVHAYLHRKEGDEFNAGFWYQQAGRSKNSSSFDKEWEEVVRELLS